MESDTTEPVETKPEGKQKRFDTRKFGKSVTIFILALSLGYIHYKYVITLFENDKNFSYLSEMEREMSFRTEMGFYYSYYKTIVEEYPFVAGISKLMRDRLVEYPKEVNAFNRFNIHPEAIIGSLYRYLEPYLNSTSHRQCHMVDRGVDLDPVESCVGIGQPIYFYLEAIWWLAGVMVAGIFLHATALSESILGGLLAVAQYFANHTDCTRVQWAPNVRENFAAPLLMLQAWLITMQLRDREKRTTIQLQVSIVILNCLCLLFWQFSQFIFLTQTAIFFVMEQLKLIDIKSLCIFLHSHFCGLHMAVLLLQGNDMLKSSLYASFFLAVSIYSLFFSSLRVKVENRVDFYVEAWLVVLRIGIVICFSFYLKKVISEFLDVQEDSHVWEILFSKLTDFKSFHALLYTCSDVFDFLPWNTIRSLFHSFLIPFVLLNIMNVWNSSLTNATNGLRRRQEEMIARNLDTDSQEETDDSGIENNTETNERKEENDLKDLDVIDKEVNSKFKNDTDNLEDDFVCFWRCFKVEPAIFYNISQMAVFGAMAGLVMRLKLLFVPQMCVVSSLMMNKNLYCLPKSYKRYIPFFWLLCMSPVIQDLFHNITEQMSQVSEFSDLEQEQLLEWIKTDTAMDAAFAGSMPILATVMLVTRRPIVAHPHYEHLEARQRAYSVYKMYGKFSPEHLYHELSKLRASYLIVEPKFCYGESNLGCTFEYIWDVEAPSLQNNTRLCHTLLTETVEHFYLMFQNDEYSVFRIHDYSLRYMPRSFDT